VGAGEPPSGLAQATPSMVCAQDSLSIVPGKVVGDEPPASISLYLRHFPSAAAFYVPFSGSGRAHVSQPCVVHS
jgi:hypothetical protein